MSENMLRLTVNGQPVALPALPGEMLSDLLRDRLGLTGTKIACNEQECGACTILMDGQPILSCSVPTAKAAGREVITVEGLAGLFRRSHPSASPDALHPLQSAFIQHGAVQCGFCTPGQLMTAAALLIQNPLPGEEDIRVALKDTLCRCAGYPRIIAAIQEAALAMRSGQKPTPPALELSAHPGAVIGTSLPRADAPAKVTGAARFTADLHFPGMLHARVLRAGIASGRLRSLDVAIAIEMPGVVAVLTAADLPAARQHGLVVADWPTLIDIGERVRTVGDALAIVAAETREQASAAIAAMSFEIEPLPIISDPVTARHPDAPAIHPKGNLLKHIQVRKGDLQAGFAQADTILEHTFHTPAYDHAFLEPECSVARPLSDGRMEIYVGSQIPYADRQQVADALGWPPERVRVIGQLIGGGFGGKEDIAGQIHAALLANATGRPVRLLYDRQESLIAHPKRHATQIRVKIGACINGRLTAVETELYGDTGAYASLGEKVMTRATTHSSGPYEVEHVSADCYAMYTNNPPAGAFRGFGVMQSAFAIESLMDRLAVELNIDPVEIRRINALRTGSITNTGQRLENSVGLLECIEKVDTEMRRLAGPHPFESVIPPGDPNKRRAWGFAVGYKNTGLGGGAPDQAGAAIIVQPDGSVEVRSASAELGQGLPTVLRMIAAEILCLPPEQVHVLLSDTDLTPDGGPTTASRQTYVTGNAARAAAQALREKLLSAAAEILDRSPDLLRIEHGFITGSDKPISMSDLAAEMRANGLQPEVTLTYTAPETQPLGSGGDMHFAYSFGAQAAEVEVNLQTGEVQVVRMIAANDVGYALNPLGLQGQVEGGILMGIGHALTEHMIIEEGQVITDRLARYRIPGIGQTPQITSYLVEEPVPSGPFGAKGVGELVLIPTIPAITNAIANATGVRIDSLPVDQEKLLHVLRA